MNGYKAIADSYRILLENGEATDRATLERKIKALDFLATCDRADIQELFNTSAFNDITKGYIKKAVDNLKLSTGTRADLLEEVTHLYDTMGADEAEDYNNH